MPADPRPIPPPTRHPGFGTGRELWLIRHAEVHEDWRGRAYGNLDVPLSSEGEARTRELARAFADLGPSLVLSSPLQRALTLGTAIREHSGAELRTEDDLKEIHRGRWQGRAVRELYDQEPDSVQAFYADPWHWRGHGGECDAAVALRAWPCIERAFRDGAHARVLVTTHYNVIRVLTSCALGSPPEQSFAFRVDPGRSTLLLDALGGWILRCSNVQSPAGRTGVAT